MEKAKERGGNLTENEIRDALRPTGMTKDQINAVIDELRIGGLEIEEDIDPDELGDLEDEIGLLPIDPEDMEAMLQFYRFPHKSLGQSPFSFSKAQSALQRMSKLKPLSQILHNILEPHLNLKT